MNNHTNILVVATPDWLDRLTPLPSNPYERLLFRLQQQELVDDIIAPQILLEKMPDMTLPEQKILQKFEEISALDIVFDAFRNGLPLSTCTKYLSWNEFEKLVATILTKGGWETQQNFRYFGEGTPSDRHRYEVDIIATKKPYVLVIDCKRYSNTSQSPMKDAALNQKERVYILYEQLPIIYDGLKSDFPKWEIPVKILPLILTWKNHQLKVFEEVAICSIDYFEDFILNISKYIDEFTLFKLQWETYI